MYSQQELDDAVAAGAISAESADGLRQFVERSRRVSTVDEEQFRLLTGFNDIFVAIASAILLFAVGWIGQSIGNALGMVVEADGPSPLAPAAVAATAWGLALFFTARRRMALPSILLLLAFIGGVFAASAFAIISVIGEPQSDHALAAGIIASISGLVAAGAAWLHWKRFHVPITIAAGALAGCAIVAGVVVAALDGNLQDSRSAVLATVLVLGIAVFLFAMRWDASDPRRETRRSDVAFWLHLLAAPMIVHPIFTLLGLNDGHATVGEGLAVIALYVALGLTALAIDRRALLVSALAYVLWALNGMFETLGAVELNVALTALVIGSALLTLSAFWHQAREAVVVRLPAALRDKLPTVQPLPLAA